MTKFLIITSTEDKASMNIRNILLNDNLLKFNEIDGRWQGHSILKLENITAKMDWRPFFKENSIYLGLTESALILLNDIKLEEKVINPDLLIFASRHRSETGRPAFLTHSTGNWSDNSGFGGNPNELSKTSAILLKAAYKTLLKQRNIKKQEDFSVDIEVTHHGPTIIEKPLIFMELGSSIKEWKIRDAGKVVAHSLFHTCLEYSKLLESSGPTIGIGFGGTHYAPQFKKLIETKNVALSFICPKYSIQNLTRNHINQMIKNTKEQVDTFIIDWKGTTSADKQYIIPLLKEFDIPIKKTKDF